MQSLDMNESDDSHNSIHTVPGRSTLGRWKNKPRLRNAHTAPLLAGRTSSAHAIEGGGTSIYRIYCTRIVRYRKMQLNRHLAVCR